MESIGGTMDQELKVKENRARRKLDRMGMRLMKSRRRDERALDFGGYMIVDKNTNYVQAGGTPGAFSMSIEEIENWIEDSPPVSRKK